MAKSRYPNGLSTSNLDVSGNVAIEGNLTVGGEVTHSSTESLAVASVTTTGNGTIGGNLAVTGTTGLTGNTTITGTLGVTGAITPAVVIAGSIAKGISVDCTDDYTLLAAQRTATYITISASGTSKNLILGMALAQHVFITNSGANNVTVKNASGDTGVAITAAKTALYIITATEPIKFYETA